MHQHKNEQKRRADEEDYDINEYILNGQVEIINQNIYEEATLQKYMGQFDLIILKDVIEHIPQQEKVLAEMKKLLAPGGKIFFGFPPWQMPFGGHQQICESKILHLLPYFHLLPRFMYKVVLKMFGEKDSTIEELMDIKSTGISLERFERICKENDYKIVNKKLYLINPIYKYKFKLTPRKQFGFISAIPYIRNYCTTCGYYLIEKK